MRPGGKGTSVQTRLGAWAVLCLLTFVALSGKQAEADSAPASTAGALPALTVVPTATPSPTGTAAPTPTSTAAPSPFPGATVSYARGWNIVAGPAGTTFLQAGAILYTSQGGDFAVLPNTQGVMQGWGYWANFAIDATVALNGAGGNSYTTPLQPGQFKMIGNPSGAKNAMVSAEVVWTYDPASGYARHQGSAVLAPGRGAWVSSSTGGTVTVIATDAPLATPTATPVATPTAATSPSPTATVTLTPTPIVTATPTLAPTPVPEFIRFAGTNSVGRDLNFDIKGDLSAVTRLLAWYEVTCPETFGFGWEEYRWATNPAIVDGRFRIEMPAGGGRTDIFAGEFDATLTTAKGTWLKWLVITYPTSSDALCSNSGTWTATRQP